MNENQKVVLRQLKKWCLENHGGYPSSQLLRIDGCQDCSKVYDAYVSLDPKQEFEILAEFAKWGLKNGN